MSVILFSSIIFGSYYFINNVTNSQRSLRSLKEENKELRYNLGNMMVKFQTLNNSLDSLSKINNDLRIAANLSPISRDENMLGIGGGSFDNSVDFLNNPTEEKLKQVLSLVDNVTRKVAFEKEQYVEISAKLKENKKLFAAIPAIRPCLGRVTDGFGMRMHPILHILRMHEGIDFEAEVGTPVYATGNGVIKFVGHRGGYGLAVEINHGFGYETVYAHLSKAEVKEGQRVKRGQEIAKTGDTGLSTGPHLHYEVRHNGIALNPDQFFFGDLGFFELTSKN